MPYLSLNDADEFWDDAMRRRTLEIPAGVACAEPVAVQQAYEGDPVWGWMTLAIGVTFLGAAIVAFSWVVLR
jgi:hypothetical protein